MVLLDDFQSMAMVLGFNWLLMGSNTYHYFLYKNSCLNLWFQEK